MVDKPQPSDATPAGAQVQPAVSSQNPSGPLIRRGPGHRGADMRDTVAEMAERAQLISQEAGSKIAAAMKDVISAGAGLAGFAIESARDLVQYMVKRGQMTPEEADKLIRAAEAAHDKRPDSEKARPTASKIAAEKAAAAKAEAAARAAAQAATMQSYRGLRPLNVTSTPAVTAEAAESAKSHTKAAAPATKSKPVAEKPVSPAKAAAKNGKAPHASKSAKAPAKAAAKGGAKAVAKAAKPKPAARPAKKGRR